MLNPSGVSGTVPILWLASFPKSGNTWLRAFLANYLADATAPVPIDDLMRYSLSDAHVWPYARVSGKPAAELADAEIVRLRPDVHAFLANTSAQTVSVKTHAAFGVIDGVPTHNLAVTAAAVYVARNPLDVVPSFADHYGLSIDRTIEVLADPHAATARTDRLVRQVTTSWSLHVESWATAAAVRRHLVRYEDLVADPAAAFGGVIAFLGLPPDADRLSRAIAFSRFDELAAQEARAGFNERSRNSDRFFRAGRAGGWRDVLHADQVARVVRAHGAAMSRLGYLEGVDAPGTV